MKRKFSEKIGKERKGKSRVLQVEVYLGRLGGQRFCSSRLSHVWGLCILLQKKVAEGAVSLDLY